MGTPASSLTDVNSVQVPPIRTNLKDPFNTDNTAKEWYLYWKKSGDRINTLNGMLTYGTSTDRLDPADAPDGAVYIESDLGGIIYQNQGGEWHYIAGTMWGTISPDQRPTDLGANDAGFEFRSIDTNPLLGGHQWIWSGSDWIETTPNRYGGHGTRLSQPLPDTWNGMIWVETDRSGVIYQNQSGVWHYLAGIMWGTISPDQRPTDLGVNDSGFQFRATDQPRQFIWSGTVWTETTPVGGYANLTHPNVVTKVSATGTITEGGITDQSAANSDHLHITSGGNIGIGTPTAQRPLDFYAVLSAQLRFSGNPSSTSYFEIGRDNVTTGNFIIWRSVGGAAIADFEITGSGGIMVPNLPGGNPGAGSKQLWYNPGDSNRVYFAP